MRGLYAITPDTEDTCALLARCEKALKGGAAVLQYRNKQADPGLRGQQAKALAQLCRNQGRLFIVNDDLELALQVDAGLHLGQEDGDLAAARKRLGPGRLLGASCYNSLEFARGARDAGADYVAFGAAFPSPTKPHAVHAPLELYEQARPLELPIVAIGGITLENAPTLIAAGVDAIAVITALFDAPDIAQRAASFAALFARPR